MLLSAVHTCSGKWHRRHIAQRMPWRGLCRNVSAHGVTAMGSLICAQGKVASFERGDLTHHGMTLSLDAVWAKLGFQLPLGEIAMGTCVLADFDDPLPMGVDISSLQPHVAQVP